MRKSKKTETFWEGARDASASKKKGRQMSERWGGHITKCGKAEVRVAHVPTPK